MNKYLKLEDEISITDSNFADEAIAYMDREGVENCDEGDFLEAFEKFNVADEVYNLSVDECFNIIRNYVKIGKYIMGYGDPVIYFNKAIDVMNSELQMASDYDEVHEDAYSLVNDYLNSSSVNYGYAQSIIHDRLVETFGKDNTLDKEVLSTYSQDVRKEILGIYKQVVIPYYEVIEQITINEVEFTDINEAQEYINKRIVVDAEAIYDDRCYLDIEVILTDKLEAFDLILNVTDAYNDVELWDTPLLEILLRLYDYFGDELESICNIQYEKYTIDLKAYETDVVGTIDFGIVYDVVYDDISKFMGNVESKEVLPFAFKMLDMNYKNDIDTLEHVKDEKSDACMAIRDHIFKRHNFEIPYHDGRADYDYMRLCYTLMFLKTFAIEDYRIPKEYAFDEDSTMQKIDRALGFVRGILD